MDNVELFPANNVGLVTYQRKFFGPADELAGLGDVSGKRDRKHTNVSISNVPIVTGRRVSILFNPFALDTPYEAEKAFSYLYKTTDRYIFEQVSIEEHV